MEEDIYDSINPDEINKKAWEGLNAMYSHVSRLVNFKYNLLLYKLLKRGHTTMENLAHDTGLTRERLYKIVESVEKII